MVQSTISKEHHSTERSLVYNPTDLTVSLYSFQFHRQILKHEWISNSLLLIKYADLRIKNKKRAKSDLFQQIVHFIF